MLRKSHHRISGIVLVAATIFPMARVSAQAATLQDQLVAQYKLVKIGRALFGLKRLQVEVSGWSD
jgi:hypothetical protein